MSRSRRTELVVLARRPRPTAVVPDPPAAMFASLTGLEQLVLASKIRRGARRARRSVLRARSVAQLQAAIALASGLAQLEYDVEQEIARG